MASEEPSPEEAIMRAFTDAEVEEAIASLPEEFRAVAVMADMCGMAYREIAEALGYEKVIRMILLRIVERVKF